VSRLILSQAPEDAKPGRDVLVGPWCLAGRDDLDHWQGFDLEADPVREPQEILREARRLYHECRRLIRRLAPRLNALNGTEFPEQSWQVLLGPWLYHLVHTVYDRQLRAERVLERHSTRRLKAIFVRDNLDFRFTDTQDFHFAALEPLFNDWLFSRVFETLLAGRAHGWTVHWEDRSSAWATRRPASVIPPLNLKRALRYSLLCCHEVRGFGLWDAAWFTLLAVVKTWLGRTPKRRQHPDWSPEWAEAASPPIRWILDIDELALRLMPVCLKDPTFLNQREQCLWRPGLYLVGSSIYYDERLKVQIAHALDRGTTVVASQHGGTYGTGAAIPGPFLCEYGHTAFVSWGWRAQAGISAGILPLPSPFLSRFEDCHRRRTDALIVVSSHLKPYFIRFDSHPQPLQALAERQAKLDLILALEPEVRAALRYRAFPQERGGLADRAFMSRHLPDLSFLEGEMHADLLRCRLAVLLDAGTTFQIAMAAGVPTVACWDPDAWPICHEARSAYAALAEAGILHGNAAAAAAHINRIWDDVEGWWASPRTQAARWVWIDLYAGTSATWRRDWTNALWRL